MEEIKENNSKKKFFKSKTMKICGRIIFGVLVVCFVFLLIGNFAGGNDVVFDVVHYRGYVVLTGSMVPDIYPGDYIVDIKTDFNKLKVGDFVTYRSEKHNDANGQPMIITHRIESIKNGQLTTKGMANYLEDTDHPTQKDYLGHCVMIIPKFGFVMNFLSKPAGMIILIALIIIITILDLLYSELKNDKLADEDENESDIKNQ
ncbi:MAG: signal peptidase I [Bacillota bacterium]|nr:signal peptidase I [Bacillota bacterium]